MKFLNPFLINFFIYLHIFFHICKTLSAKYYQKIEKDYKKKACERYQNLPKDGKDKKQQYGRQHYKISQKMKSKTLLSIEKNILKNKFIIKINELKGSFEAINLLQKAYLNKKKFKIYIKIDKK